MDEQEIKFGKLDLAKGALELFVKHQAKPLFIHQLKWSVAGMVGASVFSMAASTAMGLTEEFLKNPESVKEMYDELKG